MKFKEAAGWLTSRGDKYLLEQEEEGKTAGERRKLVCQKSACLWSKKQASDGNLVYLMELWGQKVRI